MKKSEFEAVLHIDRKAWEDTLAQVKEDQMTEPVLPSGWSVKDIIAHVVWHEREMAGMLEASALVGSEWWNLPMDERNDLIYEDIKEQSLDHVLESAQHEYARFLKAFESIKEEALNDPSMFDDMPPDWKPWKIIAENTYEHYRDHVADIEAWLSEKGKL